MPTKLVLETVGRTVDSLEQGVAATLRLVIDPRLDGVSGVYFDGLEEATADPQAYDTDARVRLWELSERLCGPQLNAAGLCGRARGHPRD